MTKANTTQPLGRLQLPDIPQRESDEATSRDQLSSTGNAHHVAQYLGNPDTTLVTADRYIVQGPLPMAKNAIRKSRYPDLLIAFDVNPDAYLETNGYVISEQGKPPDFVMEIASESTADLDVGPKRDDYAALGIPEYWRFDKTGEFHGVRLAGDRLVDGVYVPIRIKRLSDDTLRGYSAALDLYIRWHDGQLEWHDPDTGRHIPTFESVRARAEIAEVTVERARVHAESARFHAERARRMQAEARIRELEAEIRAETAETRAAAERQARLQAEARTRELEAELRRLRGS